MRLLHCHASGTDPRYPDLDGQSEIYVPSGVYGNFNAPTAPYSPLPGSFVPYYVITDANGDRLVFDRNWHPYDDIHSTVSYLAGTLTLSGAGPPGTLKAVGTYTYTFQVSAVDKISAEPISAYLITIAEPLDVLHSNTQTLQWGSGATFLTVLDSSSGRTLVFHANANGYLSGVNAPMANSNAPYTHTGLSFDGVGHLTALQVTTGERADTAAPGLLCLWRPQRQFGGRHPERFRSRLIQLWRQLPGARPARPQHTASYLRSIGRQQQLPAVLTMA